MGVGTGPPPVRFAIIVSMVRRFGAVAGFAALVAGALAFQGAGSSSSTPRGRTPEPVYPTGTVDFETKVGSFKILSPNSDVKARGTIAMSFQGTVLVVGLEGRATPGAGVKKSYDNAQRGRQVFFGKGTLTIDGKWRAIQFFGREYKGRWKGFGIMRLYGEFDDKLQTGTYTVQGQKPEPWGSGGRQVYLPAPVQPGRVKPKIEDVKRRPG